MEIGEPGTVQDEEYLQFFENDGLTFEVIDRGPRNADGTFVLLHGFPQDANVWTGVGDHLVSAGFRVLVPFQRGYTKGAMPTRTSDYTVGRLVSDVRALLDAAGVEAVHLVGHDWGGAVAWAIATHLPNRVLTVASVSMPHPRSLAESGFSITQWTKSWYLLAMQFPLLPEIFFKALRGELAIRYLIRTGMRGDSARTYIKRMLDRKRGVTCALAWYRAIVFDLKYLLSGPKIDVPAMLIWGNESRIIASKTTARAQYQVAGTYVLAVLDKVGHWIPDEDPQRLAECIVWHVELHGGLKTRGFRLLFALKELSRWQC